MAESSGLSFATIVNALSNLTQVLSRLQQTVANSFVSLAANNVFTGTNTFAKPPLIEAGATGTGTLLPEGVISAQLSAAGIGNGADVTEDTLFTFNLVANSLDSVGRGIAFLAFGTIVNNADAKTIRARFGSSVTFTVTAPINTAVSWFIKGKIYKTGASTQVGIFHGQAGASVINPLVVTGSETDTGAITIKVTGQAGAANAGDILANGMILEYQN